MKESLDEEKSSEAGSNPSAQIAGGTQVESEVTAGENSGVVAQALAEPANNKTGFVVGQIVLLANVKHKVSQNQAE